MVAVTQTVAYRQPSALDGDRLALRTAEGHPLFFAGALRAPRVSAVALAVLAGLAGTDFRRAGPEGGATHDPIVTSGADRLRAEALTACGGAYARLDLLPAALDGEIRAHGSATVDVNPALCAALSRVGAGDPLHLTVGPGGPGTAVEKRVPVPERWLRALDAAAPAAAGMDLRAGLDGPAATALLHRLPVHHGREVRWLLPAGRSVRMTTEPAPGAVCLAGAYRLAVLRPLLPMLRALRLYGPRAGVGSPPLAAGWELDLGPVRFAVLLSPGVECALSAPDPGTGLDRAGYDWSEAAWFRRELPYGGPRGNVPAAATAGTP